jgi:heat shock protein HslJ
MELSIRATKPANARRFLVREFLAAAPLVTARTILFAGASAMALGCATPSQPSVPTVSESPSVSSPSPSPSLPPATVAPTSAPTMASAPIDGFDLAGTAWDVVSMGDVPLDAELPPSIEFNRFGRSGGRGFSGCDEFGFGATYTNGVATKGDFITNPEGCPGPGSEVETAFLEAFGAVESWSTDGDLLVLNGPRGELTLARALPARGDSGRELAEAVRMHRWNILEATGVSDPASVSPIVFVDRDMGGEGTCSYSGRVIFGENRAVSITEVGWDTGGSGCNRALESIQAALQAVRSGRIEGPDRIRLSGPGSLVLLGR